MSVTETLRALGSWNLQLSEDMPASIWDQIGYYGHIVVHVGKVDPRVAGDSLLKTARYTGVLRARGEKGEKKSIGGLGMAMWLGDPDSKGDTIETLTTFTGEDFQDVITALLPPSGSVTAGAIFNIAETWTGTHQFQSRREVIDYICQTVGAAWRVNGDATLDAGLESDLFRVVPNVIVQRKPDNALSLTGSELDMFVRGFDGNLETDSDTEDFTTRVLLMAQGSNGSFASATADIDPGLNPYKDLHGNFVKLTRIVQESETDPANAPARAQLQLNRFSGTRDALSLSTKYYDIKGEAQVGDYLWVWDPEMDLVDYANEVMFRGQRIYPLKLKFTETTWPITEGMSVCYRDGNGSWIDLTDYFERESGETNIVVGGYNRSLTDGGSGAFPVTPPDIDLTVPDITVWVEPFRQGVYQSPVTGAARGDALLEWLTPLNIGGSPITDGSHYDIRYRTATTPLVPTTHTMMSAFTHAQLAVDGTFDQPITFPATEWHYTSAAFDLNQFRLLDLVPSMPYEIQIRAVDLANPSNYGAWSALAEFQTTNDNVAPATPASPEVASNLLSVQIVHRLGVSAGGAFNLDRDLHHLEVHGGSEPLFQPVDETLIGKMMANWGMITGNIPAVASFQITGTPRPPDPDPGAIQATDTLPVFFKVIAVDEAGNKSLPSAAVESSAELISSQYVSDLTASKITAGRMTAEVLMAGRIMTAETGPRVQMSHTGIQGYKEDNTLGLDWKTENGLLHVLGEAGIKVTGGGNVEITDGAVIVKNANGNVIVELGECSDGRHGLQVYKDNGLRVARIGELESPGGDGIEFVDDAGLLVRANTLAFGIAAASNAGGISTFSDVYSAGSPIVQATVTIGDTGRAIVHIGAWLIMTDASNTSGGSMGYGISGATTRAVSNIDAISSGLGQQNFGYGRSFLVTGLNPGVTNFYLAYKSTANAQIAQFFNRTIAVQPF